MIRGCTEPHATADRGRITAFRGMLLRQRPRRLSFIVRWLGDRLLTASRKDEHRHSDYRVIIPFGGGGCRWDLMNEQSARCSQPGSMPSTPAILSACSP